MQQLADAELVHAGLAVVGLGPQRLVQALGQPDGNHPRRLLPIGPGAAPLAELGQQELDFVVLVGLLKEGQLFGGREQLAEQAIHSQDFAEERDPVGLLMKHLIGNPLGGMLAIFMSDRGCYGHFHLLAPSKQVVKREITNDSLLRGLKLNHTGGDFPKTTTAVKSSMNVLALLALTTIAESLPRFGHPCPRTARRGRCTVFVQRQKSHLANCLASRSIRMAKVVRWVSLGNETTGQNVPGTKRPKIASPDAWRSPLSGQAHSQRKIPICVVA